MGNSPPKICSGKSVSTGEVTRKENAELPLLEEEIRKHCREKHIDLDPYLTFTAKEC